MTDRYAGFVVTLEKDMRDDDSEATIKALQQIKGVLSVKPIEANVTVMIGEERARAEIRKRIYDLLEDL